MAKKTAGDLTEENSIAIFPENPNRLRVEKHAGAKVGFLYVEIEGKDAGRIVFDYRKKKLELMFTQTVFSVDRCTKRQKPDLLRLRKLVCEKLGGIDVTDDQ
jgi:hypothetical protein